MQLCGVIANASLQQVFGTAPDHEATSKLPQHGFARTSRWEFLGKSTSESGQSKDGGDSSVKLDFGLSSSNLSEESKKAWPYSFGLIYSVTLGKEGLTTTMVVRNEGESAWDFQLLLHSYLKVAVSISCWSSRLKPVVLMIIARISLPSKLQALNRQSTLIKSHHQSALLLHLPPQSRSLVKQIAYTPQRADQAKPSQSRKEARRYSALQGII